MVNRRHGDWVPCVGWGDPGTALFGDPTVTLLVAAREEILVNAGAVGTLETNDNILVHRVVGCVSITQASEDALGFIHERIVVGILDDDNNFALFADDYNDASQANEPFMWTRIQQMLVAGETNMGPTGAAHPYYANIDVRVKRRLFRDQALFHVTQVVGVVGGPDPQARVVPFLRSYCTAEN